jgi:hypothetical protein
MRCIDHRETTMRFALPLSALSGLAALVLAAAPVAAQQETTVKDASGDRMTVRTDESGTTVINEPKGEAGAPAVLPAEQQHREKVQELTRGGGKVESEKSGAAAQ